MDQVTSFNCRVLYCAWDDLKDEQVFFAGSTDETKAVTAATYVLRDLSICVRFFKGLSGRLKQEKRWRSLPAHRSLTYLLKTRRDKLPETSSDPHDIVHCFLVQGRCGNP
jgi:hypothetical protein